ncbi:HAD family hydrolase [Salipaludibacillus agaradhaerens]|uniref:HAD family hydrolase n=1 Tax=Salipaludibacillus agaradhaerens TaxID=76935 RepID=A0A9Q4FZ55_SALAG|nr:HAD family hydrolase [Salipaludibacillus agaradhaerens]MCR6096424.1 HAD family hydrolase [Salipaludibacillus agaradhaerens]MCR6114017.1 HAD family hydrolase [Salipaludibacillus agaradhaerens]
MIKAILFDLDGTLLPMDTEAFISTYMSELAARVSHIVSPDIFTKALWNGTKAMMSDTNSTITNEKVFEAVFLKETGLKKEDIWPELDEFYITTFPSFSYLCHSQPIARHIVEEAVKKQYKIAVATNPVFPKAAIHHRLEWAGISDMPFDLVTVYEESTFTKPHKQYFESIAQQLDVHPSECVMVGNDKQEDMAASLSGMKTFLIEGCVIDRGKPQYAIDAKGSLDDFFLMLKRDQGIFSS